MPNIAAVLKAEISRIARKEAKALTKPLQLRILKLDRTTTIFRKRIALLEKQAKQLQGSLSKTASLPTTAAPQQTDETSRAWFTAKGLKSLRKRLGLSQADFAKLVDVSDQTVYQWEAKNGMLKLRGNTKATLVSVRNIGKVEARKRLEEKAGKAKKSVAKRKK